MSAVARDAARRVRPMTVEDVEDVVAIEREAYGFPWSEGIFRDCLRVGYSCWVLELDSLVEGYGIMAVNGEESHILNLCVRPCSQRQGLGRFILEYLMGLSRRYRAHVLLLEVRPSNHAAISLYRKLGFNDVGVRRGYYPGEHGREDALILAKELQGAAP